MTRHDIIDNRDEKLTDHINAIIKSSDRAKFAVGYFSLSGFEAVQNYLKDLKEIKLLIGNTTNRSTLEQSSEGYKRTDLPVDPPDLRQYFKDIEDGKKELPELLRYLLIRRTRIHLLKWGYAQKDNRGRTFIFNFI